jgi:L-iditol 2-dehydrogenase
MRCARLHGPRELRIEDLPIPEPANGELLVRIEACGVCATDARKYRVGVNDGNYPFNPGHEWVGVVVGLGEGVDDRFPVGARVCGDTYGGYAEYATIAVKPGNWSAGPVRMPDDVPLERAVFLEPLADCLHAVRDQAEVHAGDRVVVVAAGSMGLQIVAAAALQGAEILVVEPIEERRARALAMGAAQAVPAEGWEEAALAWSAGGVAAVILTAPEADLVEACVGVCAPGGRVVLFAGFGDRPRATLDLNALHYREISVVGSEWVGAPPNQRRELYTDAGDLLASGRLQLEDLVTDRCGFDDLEDVFIARGSFARLKHVFYPGWRQS